MPAASGDQTRQKQFKNVGKHEEMRRRRAEGSIELRKQKKDEQLMKRRNVELGSEDLDDQPVEGSNEKSPPPLEIFSLEKCKETLQHSDQSVEYQKAVEDLRKLLSRSQTPPVDDVIAAGLIPFLIKALSSKISKVQFEAAWALTNIVSGTTEQTLHVVNLGVIAPLVELLFSSEIYVAEQAAWALGNIAGENAQLRDLVIDAGAVSPMVALVQSGNISVEFSRTLAWTFSNFCRHKRPTPVKTESIKPVVPVIAVLLQSEDKQVVTDACWALSYFTDGPDDRLTLALEAGVLPSIMSLLSSEDRRLAAPAVRTLGNIVTGSDEQTQRFASECAMWLTMQSHCELVCLTGMNEAYCIYFITYLSSMELNTNVVETGVLRTIANVLSSASPPLAKECCWMVSNVLAGTAYQIQAVIEAGLIPIIIEKLDKGDFKTQTEAAWAITNLVTGGSKEQIVYTVQQNVIPPFSKLMTCKDPKIIQVVLDGLRNILELAKEMDQLEELTLLVEECGALDELEKLQQHENQDVYKKALHMIDRYFGAEEQEEVENKENCQPTFNAPEAPQGGFEF